MDIKQQLSHAKRDVGCTYRESKGNIMVIVAESVVTPPYIEQTGLWIKRMTTS